MSSAPQTVTAKLIESHRVTDRESESGQLSLRIDQTLTQDATGTLVMLELEALGLDRVRTEVSAQYVDHNLLQTDYRNPDDHLFLQSACRRFGVWFSRPGNGVSHPLHMQYFGRPGATLLGSDSHTCAGGALGMLAIGAGGLDVAMAMAGEPFSVAEPEVWGIHLTGKLPPWVSAKDVILEMLRRHGVAGGLGRVIEYHGPGLASLDVWDRHVIANMGAELGATTTVFPADEVTHAFLLEQGRGEDYAPLQADPNATYDVTDSIDLSALEPLVAKPSSPGNVVPVHEVEGTPIYQSYIGSSANPGFRDYAIVADIVAGRTIAPGVSLDINPSTRLVLSALTESGHLQHLLGAGARIHQAGCNGCIGMGQAPASGRNSLRTTPRNFPGRSGTPEDSVWLCSPETAAASALEGALSDPRRLGPAAPIPADPSPHQLKKRIFLEPAPSDADTELITGPNIMSLPPLEPVDDELELPILLAMGDDISTDEISPAGARVLPFRSNIEKLSEFCFKPVDDTYFERAKEAGDHALMAGDNYGQGSSREHAALAPRYLGLRAVLAKSFARIHLRNLILFGVLPLRLEGELPEGAAAGSTLKLTGVHAALEGDGVPKVELDGKPLEVSLPLSARERAIVRDGGLIASKREELDQRKSA